MIGSVCTQYIYTIFVSYTLVRLGKKKRWGVLFSSEWCSVQASLFIDDAFCIHMSQNPAPAARESAWRDEQCQWRMMQPLTQGTGLHVYFKLQVFFYTLIKALGQRSGHFKFPFTQIYCLHKTLLPFKQSFCFSDSLRILFTLTCDYIVTHAYVWAAYHIPQFISYLSKSCLPLAS